jgi:hypothetical protein
MLSPLLLLLPFLFYYPFLSGTVVDPEGEEEGEYSIYFSPPLFPFSSLSLLSYITPSSCCLAV